MKRSTERFLTTAGGDVRRLRLAMLFAMTYVGAPTIYYGDEVAMEGKGDPDCRRPFYWAWPEETDRTEVRNYVKGLIGLRKEHPCLVSGSYKTLLADGGLYAFRRKGVSEEALVLLNAGADERSMTLAIDTDSEAYLDPFDGTIVPLDREDEESVVTLTLPALSGRVLISR